MEHNQGAVDPPVDLRVPFRGSLAVAAGAVTADRLRGPRFRRLAPDVHVAASTPVTLRLFLDAVSLWRPDAVVAGLAAAAVWCRADDLTPRVGGGFAWPGVGDLCPVEVVVTTRARAPAGVRVREDVLDEDEIATLDGLRVTGPARTVLDLVRCQPRDVAVVAADAVARRGRVTRADVADLADRMPGSRGLVAARAALRLVDPRSGSVGISRMRLALRDHGVRPPVVDHVVLDDGWPVALADLAWPELRCAALCGERELVPHSAVRASALRSLGWSVWWSPAESAGQEAGVVALAMMLRAASRREAGWRVA